MGRSGLYLDKVTTGEHSCEVHKTSILRRMPSPLRDVGALGHRESSGSMVG